MQGYRVAIWLGCGTAWYPAYVRLVALCATAALPVLDRRGGSQAHDVGFKRERVGRLTWELDHEILVVKHYRR